MDPPTGSGDSGRQVERTTSGSGESGWYALGSSGLEKLGKDPEGVGGIELEGREEKMMGWMDKTT